MKSNTLSAVTLGLAIMALAAGLIAYYATSDALAAIGIAVLIIGALVAATSVGYSAAPDKFGPSARSHRLATGLVAAVAGAVLLLAWLGVDAIILAAIFIIGVAAIGIAVALSNDREAK
jgi:hypothetical protein